MSEESGESAPRGEEGSEPKSPLPSSLLLCLGAQVMQRAHWDDEREVWVLERLSDVGKREVVATGTARRPVSASGQRRPMSGFAKIANQMGQSGVTLLCCHAAIAPPPPSPR